MAAIANRLAELDRQLIAWHRSSTVSQRLATIPWVGPVTASALAATVADPAMFASGRESSAFLGLVPRQNSSGGKVKLGVISKMGDRYLRHLLVSGAAALLSHAKTRRGPLDVWAEVLVEKNSPIKLVAVAFANKMARLAWTLMIRGESFRQTANAAA